jgi:hypothetical protein
VQHQSVGQLRIAPAQFILSLLAAVALILSLFMLVRPVLANPPDPAGNNGTVKVHEEPGEAEPIVRNEPHVGCAFHFHFFFADAGQTGTWWVESWPPTGDKTTVMGPEEYGPTDANGEWRTIARTLPSGHYKLFWQGRNEQNVKHKVFWVECEGGGGQGESASLSLVKVDTNGGTLSDVEFTLTGVTDTGFSAVATTDANGQLTFTDLVEGTYVLTETANANADCDTSGMLTVTVSAAGEVSVTDDTEGSGVEITGWDTETNTLTVENHCGGGTAGSGLNLVKLDENGDALGDVTFHLSLNESEFAVDETTAANGQLTFSDLGAGTFTLTETINGNGDCDISGELTVEISDAGVITITDDDDTTGINIKTWDSATNTLTIENNCQGGGTSGGGSNTPPTRGGTKGSTGGPGGNLPNTAATADPAPGQLPMGLLVLAVLGSLGLIGRLNLAAARSRRR